MKITKHRSNMVRETSTHDKSSSRILDALKLRNMRIQKATSKTIAHIKMTSYKRMNNSFSWFCIKKIADATYFVESKRGRATQVIDINRCERRGFSEFRWNVKNSCLSSFKRVVHFSHQFFGEVTNQVTNFKSPIFLFQVTKMCYIIQLR